MQENENNIDTWNKIAKSFDKTRNKPWQICIDFIKNQIRNDVIVDLGCGNGRHLIPAAKYFNLAIGIDFSEELIDIVKKKVQKEKITNIKLINSDLRCIPLEDNFSDSVIYIAALHNIKGRNNRINSLRETKRILKSNGTALISVWSRYQDKFRDQFLFKGGKKPQNEKEFGDIDIYWTQDKLDIPRFYHLYSKKEFTEDLKRAGFNDFKIKSVKIASKKYTDNYFAYIRN
jgi:alkylated DNA repair protein alkB family protein 8